MLQKGLGTSNNRPAWRKGRVAFGDGGCNNRAFEELLRQHVVCPVVGLHLCAYTQLRIGIDSISAVL